jgi:hypothetical protein
MIGDACCKDRVCVSAAVLPGNGGCLSLPRDVLFLVGSFFKSSGLQNYSS